MVYCNISINSIMLIRKLFTHKAAQPSTIKIIIIFNNSFISLSDQMDFLLYQFPLGRQLISFQQRIQFSRRIIELCRHMRRGLTLLIFRFNPFKSRWVERASEWCVSECPNLDGNAHTSASNCQHSGLGVFWFVNISHRQTTTSIFFFLLTFITAAFVLRA